MAQYCDWLNAEGGITDTESVAVATDNANNSIVLGMHRDSITVGTTLLSASPSLSQRNGLVIKYNTNGQVQWAVNTNYYSSPVYYSVTFSTLTVDTSRSIYATGILGGNVDFGNGVKVASTGNGVPFLVKYDSNGVAQWVNVLQQGIINTTSQSCRLCTDKDNNILWLFDFGNTTTFNNSSQILTSIGNNDIGLVKYKTDGTFIKAVRFGGEKNDFAFDIGVDDYSNVYIVTASDSVIKIGTQTFTDTGVVLLKLDSALNPIKARKTKLNISIYNRTGVRIAVQGNGKVAFFSFFLGLVDFGGVQLKTHAAQLAGYGSSCCLVYYDTDLTPLWARKNDVVLSGPPFIIPEDIVISAENIYICGSFTRFSLRFGSTVLNYAGTGFLPKYFVSKADTLGNFLWSIASPDTISENRLKDIAVDSFGDVIIAGNFTKQISVFNRTAVSNNKSLKDYIFVAKIADYTITRGFVKSGPYCAGDSIYIPYTKKGFYNPGNQFIAQLSDSAGDFDGGEIELGRVTDTLEGTISGVLPLFNVATNNKYRIRIISTNPIVQSFYKKDSLRLLVYSKDTANAGADQTICNGQKITLGTTGGSRWEWSPTNYFVNPADSGNRQPQVKPDNTTEFRIIISDSSGCGAIDTDYVKIYVRPELKNTIQGDSLACRGLRQTLKAVITGGDSTHYWYIWKTVGFNIISSTTNSLTIRPVTTTQYMIVTGDSCSNKIDTTYFTVNVQNNLKALATSDTSLCLGKSITLGVTGIGCNPNKYTYEWYKNGSSTIVSTSDTLTVNPTTTTSYSVILKDTSTFLVDTAHIKVTVYQPLQLTVNADSTICLGEVAELRAATTGGNPNKYQLQWTANNQQLSTNNTVQVTPTTTTTYKALLSDGCSLQNDSAEIKITVRPPLKLTVNLDTTICIGENAQLRATATGGLNTNHKLQWTANNQQLSTSNQLQVTPTTTTTYWATLSDGCTTPNDSVKIAVFVRLPLKVTVNPDTTVCTGETVILKAITTGGNPNTYQQLWTVVGGLWTDTNNTVQVTPTTTTTYKVLLKDNCTTLNDSALITITVRPPLSIKGTAKDSICANQILLLTATPQGGYILNHQILWSVDNGLWTSFQNPATDTPKITTKYIVQLSDNCSPTVYDTLKVIVLPVPQANFTFSPAQGCPPLTVDLKDNSTGNDTTLNSWSIGNTEYQNIANFAHQFTQTGTYSLKLTVVNALGCADQKVQPSVITVFPKPKADFIVKPDIKETEEPLTLLNRSTTNTVIWDMGDGNQLIPNPTGNGDTTYTYHDTGWLNLKLIAQNNLGCYDTATQKVLIYDKVHCIIPSAFTPNGNDNINPVFAPVCVGVASYTLTIYNRWGQIIYLQENGAWDGTYSDSPVPNDVYMYKLQIQADSKKKKLTYGTVQVIR